MTINEICENYINGNISDVKKEVKSIEKFKTVYKTLFYEYGEDKANAFFNLTFNF